MEMLSINSFVQQRQEDPTTNLVDASMYNDTGIQLLSLPDFCLQKVFADRSLNLMDLCRIAETCKRFQWIAQSVIRQPLTFTAFESRYTFRSSKLNHISVTRSDAARLFRNFGWCVSDAVIGSRNLELQSFAFDLVKDHSDEELKHLIISNLHIPATHTEELKPVFRRIHTFHLNRITIEGNRSMFSELNSLVELEVLEVRNCNAILENLFPQLERFTYTYSVERPCEDLPSERLHAFITSHRGLKFLEIGFRCTETWWRNIFQAIASSCPDLAQLVIYDLRPLSMNTNVTLKPLQSLKSLKLLKLSAMSLKDLEIFAPMTGLRELRLVRCIIPTDVNQFAFLPQVQTLFLTNCESLGGTYDESDIVQQLVSLVKLQLVNLYIGEWKCLLNATKFAHIVNIVKERPNVLKLICRCDSTVQRSVNQNVKLFRLGRNRSSTIYQ